MQSLSSYSLFFRELEQITSQFVWKYKKTSNSQSNLEKEEWNWSNQPAWLEALVQSHSPQNCRVLAQRQKYRSMEQNRKPRDKSMHLCAGSELHPRQRSWGRRLGICKGRMEPQEFPCKFSSIYPPKPESAYFLLCAFTYTSDSTGGCPPLPLSEKRVSLQLQLIIPGCDSVSTYKLLWKSSSLPE